MPAAPAPTVACISAPPYSPPAAPCTQPKRQDGGSPLPHLHFGPVDQRIGWIEDDRIGRLEAGQYLDRIPIVAPNLNRNQRDTVVFDDTDPQSLSAKQKR